MRPLALGRVGPLVTGAATGWVLVEAMSVPHLGWCAVPTLGLLMATLARAHAATWGSSGAVLAAVWYHAVPGAVGPEWGTAAALATFLWPCAGLGLLFFVAGFVSRGWPVRHRVFALCMVWPAATTIIEGVTWTPLMLAPSWAMTPSWLGITRILGTSGFDGLILTLAGALALILDRHFRPGLAVASLVLVVLTLGRYAPVPPAVGHLRVVGLQPNVATRDFERAVWSLYERRSIEQRLDAMTEAAVRQGADLVVWPEGGNELSNLGLPRRIRALNTLTASSATTLLIGSREVDTDGRISNTASTWTRRGVGQSVTKAHPVPFAEAKLQAGAPGVVQVGQSWAGVAICFDALFAHHFRALVSGGAEYVVVVSDDASLADPRMAVWHEAYARVRATAVARPLVFVSNAGPTTAADARGQGLAPPVPLNGRGTLTVDLPRVSGTVAAYYLTYPWAGLLLLAAALGGRRGRDRRWRFDLGPGLIAVVVIGLLTASGLCSDRNSAAPRDDLAPLFRQRGQRDCGAAALAFALTFLGDEVYEGQLTEQAPHQHPGGYSMAELVQLAHARGFTASGWVSSLDRLAHLGGGVAILHLSVGHFVTVLGLLDDTVILFDPALGRTVEVPRQELEPLYSGRALLLTPGARARPGPRK